jgi:hypothetical protein
MSTGLFDPAAEQLEHHTGLDRLEARGTLRLAIKQAGLDARRLTLRELDAIFEKVMPEQLATRGIDQPSSVCKAIMAEITRSANGATTADVANSDEVLGRLGGQ